MQKYNMYQSMLTNSSFERFYSRQNPRCRLNQCVTITPIHRVLHIEPFYKTKVGPFVFIEQGQETNLGWQ